MDFAITSGARTVASFQFLKMVQPLPNNPFGEYNALRAGNSVNFDFHFIVPERLLPTSCFHNTHSVQLKKEHHRLPPSLGDPNIAGRGEQLLNDLAPRACRVSYGVRVRLNVGNGERRHRLASEIKLLRLIPARDEGSPLVIDDTDVQYCVRKQRGVRENGLLSDRGRLAMEALQPRSLHLPPPLVPWAQSSASMATIALRFDPAGENYAPPALGLLSTKIKAATIFASGAMYSYPNQGSFVYDNRHGCTVKPVDLPSRNVRRVRWQLHGPGTKAEDVAMPRAFIPGSHTTTVSVPCPRPTDRYNDRLPFYTAQIIVPLSLPTRTKAWLPTYYHCISARYYVLEFSLSLRDRADMVGPIELKIPIEISTGTASDGPDDINASDTGRMVEVERRGYHDAPQGAQYTYLDGNSAGNGQAAEDEEAYGHSLATMQREDPPGYAG